MSYAALTIVDAAPLTVLSFRGVLDIKGAWYWTMVLDATPLEAPKVGARGTFVAGGRGWTGYVVRAQEWQGRTRLFFEAGVQGMRTVIDAASYDNALARTIIQHVVTAAGETLDEDSAQSTDVIEYYSRAKGLAGLALSDVARAVGLSWRFTDEGRVWVGAESWPDASEVDVLEVEPFGEDGSTRVEPLTPSLSPGEVYGGRRIVRVTYSMSEDSPLSGEILFERPSVDGGDMRGLFARAVRAQVPELPYLSRLPATVVRQAEDGKVELQPDSPVHHGTPPIPVLYGLPGARAEGLEEGRLGLIHEGGDQRRPRAMGWETSAPCTLLELEASESIKLGVDAERGVVRLNDSGDGGQWTITGTGVQFSCPLFDGVGPTIWELQGNVSGTPVVFTLLPISGTPGKVITKATRASNIVRAV